MEIIMKRLLLITLLASSLAPAMEPQQERLYNTQSLRFLAGHAVGQIYKPKFIEEKTRFPQELKDHVLLLERHSGKLNHYHAQQILIDSCMKGILNQQLLDDLRTISPNLNMNCTDGNNSPLTWAIWKMNIPLIVLLLDHGADINFKTDEVLPALHQAIHCSWAYEPEATIKILKTLLTHGAKLENSDKHGQTVLMHAVEQKKLSENVIRFLLEEGATAILNHQDSLGNTALMHAVRSDNIPALKVLLEYNPFYEPVNVQGHTAFSLACDQGNLMAMDLLHDAGANINHRNQRNYNRTPLFEAVCSDKDDVAVKLLEYDADIELAENYSEETPLFKAVQRKNQRIATALAILGANIHARESSGKTPLIKALESEELILAILLLSKSAEDIPVRSTDDYLWGLTKLVGKDDAINHDIMKLLLSKGILRSFQGTTLEAKVAKDRLMHAATPSMKKLILNYRKPVPPQLSAPKAPMIGQEETAHPLRLPKEEFQANCIALRQLQHMGMLSKAVARIKPNGLEQIRNAYDSARMEYFNRKYKRQ